MSLPENPETIIIKNEFYPSGLTEKDIYNYYIQNKNLILKNSENRNLMIFLATDVNKFIVKRKKGDDYIKLTGSNYEKEITGRTVSIHEERRQYENTGVIDIDYHDFNKIKECADDVYGYIVDKLPIAKQVKIVYTGKTGIHIRFNLDKLYNVDAIRMILLKELRASSLSKKYTIGFKRTEDKPNLDLGSSKIKGNIILVGSLSIIGLKCMVIDYNDLSTFKKSDAKI